MSACDETNVRPQQQPIDFHAGPAIAALLAALLRNAADSTRDFGNFACQLEKTVALAEVLERRGVSGAEQFVLITNAIKAFHDASDENKELFNRAHFAIRDLLLSLPNLDEWGPCNYVSHSSLAQIVSLQ